MTTTKQTLLGLSLALIAPSLAHCSRTPVSSRPKDSAGALPQDPATALQSGLAYLDGRAAVWTSKSWSFVDSADHTCALSCHTTLPYMLTSASTPAGGNPAGAAAVRAKLAERVTDWASLKPYYDFAKDSSRATESAVSVVALAASERGSAKPSDLLVSALNNAFDLQGPDGDWNWMDEKLAPFEDAGAHYWGTALFAYGLGLVPGGYQAVTDPAKVQSLQKYLRDQFAGQSLHARLMAVRAAAAMPGLLAGSDVDAVRQELLALQKADGSWSVAALGDWKTKDGTVNDGNARAGDGYGTGLAVLALLASGSAATDPALVSAMAWLLQGQDGTGAWRTASLNSPGAKFNDTVISDVSTAYAVMAVAALK